jgi:uncharacterized protein
VTGRPFIGVISDTHGLLRPQAVDGLVGSELILHAGDIGGEEILEQLSTVADVVAVRGNNDRAPWAHDLPETTALTHRGVSIFMIHDVKDLDASAAADARVVVSGHSHKPRIQQRDGTLYLNPGSAGPRRFKLPVSIAKLYIDGARPTAEIIELKI